MRTAEEVCDEIAKALYMGEIPDIWTLMAKHFIVKALNEFADERLENAAMVMEEYLRDCGDSCLQEAQDKIRALKSGR